MKYKKLLIKQYSDFTSRPKLFASETETKVFVFDIKSELIISLSPSSP